MAKAIRVEYRPPKPTKLIANGPRMRAVVFGGTREKTYTGFKKTDLTKNKRGRIVTKKASAAGQKSYKRIKSWTLAHSKAREVWEADIPVVMWWSAPPVVRTTTSHQVYQAPMPPKELGITGWCPPRRPETVKSPSHPTAVEVRGIELYAAILRIRGQMAPSTSNAPSTPSTVADPQTPRGPVSPFMLPETEDYYYYFEAVA